jgi:putative ABC transport system permease protein
MKFDKIIKSSVKCLILTPLRTFLSLLGIIIGIAGVVAVINLGESTKEKIKEFVSLMGSDTFRIDVSDLLNPAVEVAIKQPPSRRLTIEDFVMIKKLCPHVEEVCELLSVVYPTKDENLMINTFGTLPNFANLAKIKLIKGRFINDTDIQYRRYVCVLEQSPLIIKIFGKIPSIGEILTFGTEKFELVGIVKREKLLFPGRETILEAYVSYTTVIERIRNVYGEIYVSVEKPQDVKIAMKEVDEILRSLFVGKQPYKTFSHEVLLKESLKTVSTSTLLMTGIAILSLIVGSIGIMNVMFISVVE